MKQRKIQKETQIFTGIQYVVKVTFQFQYRRVSYNKCLLNYYSYVKSGKQLKCLTL